MAPTITVPKFHSLHTYKVGCSCVACQIKSRQKLQASAEKINDPAQSPAKVN